MSSLRRPTATWRPAYDARAGRSAATEAGTSMVVPPKLTVTPESVRSMVARAMFIGGEPMKPATKMLSGWS